MISIQHLEICSVGERDERIDAAVQLGFPEYQRLKLSTDFEKSIGDVRHCLKIRNQYTHWVWWDDYSGQLALANVENSNKYKRPIKGLRKLKRYHVDVPFLKDQEAYSSMPVFWRKRHKPSSKWHPGIKKNAPVSADAGA